MFSRLLLQPQPWPWRQFSGRFHGDVHNGRCELHGLAQDAEVPVFFFDPKNELGATAVFSVKAAKDGPITVRLEPCGMAMARLVDPKGKPLAGYRDPYLISMIVTPGPDRLADAEADKADLSAEGDYLSRIDPDHYADLALRRPGPHHVPRLDPRRDLSGHRQDRPERQRIGRRTRKEFVAGSGERHRPGRHRDREARAVNRADASPSASRVSDFLSIFAGNPGHHERQPGSTDTRG